jgi:hypothetical protein
MRARDAPARLAYASDDTVKVAREEDGDLGVRLVHLDPQDAILVATTLCDRGAEERSKRSFKNKRSIKAEKKRKKRKIVSVVQRKAQV